MPEDGLNSTCLTINVSTHLPQPPLNHPESLFTHPPTPSPTTRCSSSPSPPSHCGAASSPPPHESSSYQSWLPLPTQHHIQQTPRVCIYTVQVSLSQSVISMGSLVTVHSVCSGLCQSSTSTVAVFTAVRGSNLWDHHG